jgi:hypothetical protein
MVSPSHFYLVTRFVREMPGQRQARPSASLKTASRPRESGCTIIRMRGEWQEL